MQERAALFAMLAGGQRAACTVVTPNRRLARALTREFDAFQLARGLDSWEAADILPLGGYLERLWDDALHGDVGDGLPMLLSPAQEQHLWEEAIRGTERGKGLLAVPQTAAQCRAAWQLMHAWRLGASAGHGNAARGHEDAEAFAEWSRAYLKRAGADTDGARLPDLAAQWIAPGKPGVLVAYAFDIVTPQARAFFDACEARGIEVRSCDPSVFGPPFEAVQPVRVEFAGEREELAAAARWARARLESGAKRIGIVVPGLQLRRKEVVRVFARVMGSPLPFNVSLGQPLEEFPIVHAALAVLALAAGEVEFAFASRLIRSPFIGGAETEFALRAQLDARLRRKLPATLSLARLVAAIGHCPLLRERLGALFNSAKEGGTAARTPHEWARHFTALLKSIGYPGERGLDSAEFQAHARWNETLAELACLERVAPRMTQGQALAKLRRLCAGALFQPESPDAPVQVLGILESAGLEFDCLWVSGLSDEAWPLAARPDPFIPVALLKKAGVPEASAEGSYELDRRITAHWFCAAREVIVSHPLRVGDRELSASPLIAAIAEGKVEAPAFPGYRDVLFAARARVCVADGIAPPIPAAQVRGGTKVLSDQAACPFRAFARHRLGARALEEPADGLDASARGDLLHELMARLWRQLKDSTALATDVGPAIERAAAGAVAELEIEGRFAALERTRLAKLAREWLAIERERGPFSVAAVEDERGLAIGPLEFSGRIDRMDRLADGTHALIDYKTGQVTRQGWIGERPLDPQLPLYAVTAREDVSAIAFARLKTGQMKFTGYGADGALVEKAKDWESLKKGWKAELDSLAGGFAAGGARVDPKGGLKACRLCDLQPLCRVHEKMTLVDDDEDGADAAAFASPGARGGGDA